jgi:hypothetical protein
MEGGMERGREGGREGTENSAQSTVDEVERHVIRLVHEHLQQFDDQSNRITANVKSIHFYSSLEKLTHTTSSRACVYTSKRTPLNALV